MQKLTPKSVWVWLCCFGIAYQMPPLAAQSIYTFMENGRSNLRLQAYEDATKDFTSALIINPQAEDAFFYRAEAYAGLEKWEEALRDYNAAIALDPHQALNFSARGAIYLHIGKGQEALADFNKAIEIAGNSAPYYAKRAETYLLMGDWQKALEDCNYALQISPQEPQGYLAKAKILYEVGQSAAALTALKTALKYDPYQEPIYSLALADYYLSERMPQQALQEYDKVVQRQYRNKKAHLGKAQALLELNQLDRAEEECKRALQFGKQDYYPYAVKAMIAYKKQDYAKSNEDFNTFLQAAQKPSDYYFAALQVSRNSENKAYLAQAQTWLEKNLSQSSHYHTHLLHVQLLKQQQKLDEAATAAQQVRWLADEKGYDIGLIQTLIAQLPVVQITKERQLNYAMVAPAKNTDDKTPPTIEIIEPMAMRGFEIVSEEDKITIAGRVSDESGIDKVLISGNVAKLEQDGRFKGDAVLTKQENHILIKAFDKKGNFSEQQVVVKKPTTAATQVAQHSSASTSHKNQMPVLGRNKALLFAGNEYDQWADLNNPIPDAQAIAKELREVYQFETEIVENPTQDLVLEKLLEYTQKAYGAKDQLFVFFAGHGQFDEVFKEGYLVTKDSRTQDRAKSSYLGFSQLRKHIDNIGCKHILLSMDVCFGGTIDPMVAMRGEEQNSGASLYDYIERKMAYTTRRYITSGGKEYVSDGLPGQHSPFARNLLEALRSNGGSDGLLNLDEMFNYLKNSKALQGEFGSNEPGSDFFLIAK